MDEVKACSFTGHRIIEPSHKARIDDLVYRSIEYAYEKGCRAFYSGGAVGFDTVAARQVIKFRMAHRDVKLVMVIPCKNQSEKWTAEQKNMYNYCLGAADTVMYLSIDYTADCMKRRNEKLVLLSDLIIAYVKRQDSGAAQTVRMALKAGRTVYNLYPTLEKENK